MHQAMARYPAPAYLCLACHVLLLLLQLERQPNGLTHVAYNYRYPVPQNSTSGERATCSNLGWPRRAIHGMELGSTLSGCCCTLDPTGPVTAHNEHSWRKAG